MPRDFGATGMFQAIERAIQSVSVIRCESLKEFVDVILPCNGARQYHQPGFGAQFQRSEERP